MFTVGRPRQRPVLGGVSVRSGFGEPGCAQSSPPPGPELSPPPPEPDPEEESSEPEPELKLPVPEVSVRTDDGVGVGEPDEPEFDDSSDPPEVGDTDAEPSVHSGSAWCSGSAHRPERSALPGPRLEPSRSVAATGAGSNPGTRAEALSSRLIASAEITSATGSTKLPRPSSHSFHRFTYRT